MSKPKRYFQEPRESVVSNLDIEEINPFYLSIRNVLGFRNLGLVDRILRLQEGQCIVLNGKILPESYENAWHFFKYGPKVVPNTAHAVKAFSNRNFTPLDLRIESFNDLGRDILYSGYEHFSLDIAPYSKKDNRKKRISLVECMEAARLFAYSHQILEDGIEIRKYAETREDGATFSVRVPSRSTHHSKYEINIFHVPLVGNLNRFFIAKRTYTDTHSCKKSWRMNHRQSEQLSDVFDWCAHGAAGFLEVAYQEFLKANKTPKKMSQIAIPQELAVTYYQRLCDSVFINDNGVRPLNKAEQEILLWELVKNKKHYKTFFGFLPQAINYNWSLRHI